MFVIVEGCSIGYLIYSFSNQYFIILNFLNLPEFIIELDYF